MLDLNSQIGGLLHADHVSTIATLHTLDGLIERSIPNLADAQVRAALLDLVRVVADEVDRHFAFEEGELFPLLARLGQTGMVGLLTAEHHAILPAAREAGRLAADALERGSFTAGEWTDFQEVAAELIERELFHIQKEEMGLLAAVAALLPADEDARLADAFRALG